MKNLLRIVGFGLAAYGGYSLVSKVATWYWGKYGDDIKRQVRNYVIDQVYNMVKEANSDISSTWSSENLQFGFDSLKDAKEFVSRVNHAPTVTVNDILNCYSQITHSRSYNEPGSEKVGYRNGVSFTIFADGNRYLVKAINEPCIL